MHEIGTWTTSEGTIGATLQLEADMGDDATAQELPKWVSGALSGALGGAATGAVAGPWGIVAGAATGAALGGAAAAMTPSPSPPSPPSPPTPAPKAAPPQAAPVPPQPGGSQAGAPTVAAPTQTIQALQQLAAAMPALMQLIAASNANTTAKPAEFAESDDLTEFVSEANLATGAWTPDESEAEWSTP